jgi:hypothetical protein
MVREALPIFAGAIVTWGIAQPHSNLHALSASTSLHTPQIVPTTNPPNNTHNTSHINLPPISHLSSVTLLFAARPPLSPLHTPAARSLRHVTPTFRLSRTTVDMTSHEP